MGNNESFCCQPLGQLESDISELQSTEYAHLYHETTVETLVKHLRGHNMEDSQKFNASTKDTWPSGGMLEEQDPKLTMSNMICNLKDYKRKIKDLTEIYNEVMNLKREENRLTYD